MKSIFLFGPFTGSLSWEFYRFAPHAIFMKKIYPKIKIAVLTRSERFDLYGQYADFLLPLKIKEDNVQNQVCFKLRDFKTSEYDKLVRQFKSMYGKRFDVEKHYYPDIIDYRYKLRWQFSKSRMNYDFRPRNKNIETIRTILPKKPFILVTPPYNTNFMQILSSCIIKNKLHKKYLFLTYDEYGGTFKNINNIPINKNASKIGYLIEIIKRSRLVIGPKSDLTHLSLLLKCPVISWGDKTNLNLINPFDTRIVLYNNIPDSIEKDILEELKMKKNREIYNCI